MSEKGHLHSHKKEYFIIFVMLAVLTVLEIMIPDMKNLSKFAKGSSLTFLAVGKAFLVGYYYMHLKMETKWMKAVALIPVSAAIYATVVVLETLSR